MVVEDATSSVCDLGILDSLNGDAVREIMETWNGYCFATEAALLNGRGDLSFESKLVSQARNLCKYGLESLVEEHFAGLLEETFEKNGASKFWEHFDVYSNVAAREMIMDRIQKDSIQQVLCKALEEISMEKQYQEKCLLLLIDVVQPYKDSTPEKRQNSGGTERLHLLSKYQSMVSSVLMATLPPHFPEILHWYFKGMLEEFSTIMADDCEDDSESHDKDEKSKLPYRTGDMDVEGCYRQNRLLQVVKNVGIVVHDLRNLGFTSMAEDAYASAIFLLLKATVHNLAGDDYRSSALESIKGWIQAVPLQFLHALLAYLGDSINYDDAPSSGLKSPLVSRPSSCYAGIDSSSEGLVRWQLRLEYFAYETLQDLRIAKLFEIIVDYPDSSPAIEDLKQCLEYTGQHSKLVVSFISALRYRLLTAGASTNDLLHLYVSTIKALRTINPAGVFLEAVGEPIREYLKGRKDTIKCIVTMLTDGTGRNSNGPGNTGDSLLEELNRDEESQVNTGVDDDFNTDDKQAWINAHCWEPDPVEADPLKGSRNQRKVDILGMIVSIIGSKDQLVNEYRVMLAEKLLNKSDYDIDAEIRTLELLKIHFGESSMQRCEIMLNDLIDSKRTNANLKATILQRSQTGAEAVGENGVSLDILNATIISSNFWPPTQDESFNIPEPVDRLLSDYAKRFNEVKTPRKLLWKKNLGTVKLELQFEDRSLKFTVTPLHASIITQFQDQTSWTAKNLSAAIGLPIDVLHRRINFWISKGILSESLGADSNDHIFTLVDGTADTSKTGANTGGYEELVVGDDDGDRSVASVEDQLHKEMAVYEKFVIMMLRSLGGMESHKIHNKLKMFYVADPRYDKSPQQLESFLSGLVAEDKLELIHGGIYKPV
ncbi:anaphase-promoting complex subunit 2-like isoform X2 [Rhododendron vialii]|uniref:anaphase-promoting complex subunit 2-like isoform X2 n=1 Tax=Rhododendron vialii TaxID=182163 RepID=UPI00265E268A|nr:anaphase-promoting complex subunit 2-like isoform X2 [Rhododendron vialii]